MKAQIFPFSKTDIGPEQVCFVYHEQKILMMGDRLPTRGELEISPDPQSAVFKMREGWALSGAEIAKKSRPGKLEFRNLKEIMTVFAIPVAKDAAIGAQLVNWADVSKFCGSCGKKSQVAPKDIAKYCGECDSTVYPTLTPVVIVLVRRGKEILLAKGLTPKKFYSCLAGFAEPGETLEEAIRREVKEEVGLEVKNIRYFGSQPWPFPNNLMVGFTADWIAGEIKVDETELADAQWHTKEKLAEVELPTKLSIARQMIEAFKKG